MEQKLAQEELTECELIVLKVIWDSEEALSIQEVTERVNRTYEKEWKVQTVSAFLGHIVQKGYLSMERKGRRFFYRPLVSEDTYRERVISKSIEFWSGGRADVYLASLLKQRTYTEEEKRRIRSLIDELDW